MRRSRYLLIPVLFMLGLFCSAFLTGLSRAQPLERTQNPDLVTSVPENLPKASFAGGCFWCMESEFRPFPGVVFTRAGYEGGTTDNPTYAQVTTGKTGHAEVLEIYYDPSKTDYQKLVDHFMRNAHDPTTLNQQWVDEGTQYRSVIFYHDAAQQKIAEDTIARIDGEKIYKGRIVTEVIPATTFWIAEEYHQQYYEKYEKEKGTPHIREVLKDEIRKKKVAEALRP